MRYYFDVRDRLPIRDRRGREFDCTWKAIVHAKHLAADIRSMENEVRPELRICVVAEPDSLLHEEPVYDRSYSISLV